MMPTEKILELQKWYLLSLERAVEFAHLPVQRKKFEQEFNQAMDEFEETYGQKLPALCTRGTV